MPRFRRPRRTRWLTAALAVVLILAAVVLYGVVSAVHLEVKEYTFTSPQVPAAFDGCRIALLTDIHRGAFFTEARVRRLVTRVNALAPDLIALGGDYVFGNTDYERSVFAQLAGLRAPLGRFGVLGNHDYGRPQDADGAGDKDPRLAAAAMQAAGIQLLDNQAVWIEKDGQRLRLGGVSDLEEGVPYLAPTIEGTSPADLVILLSHEPDYAEDLPEGTVDLMLSGHTHGGQIAFFGRWAFHLPSEYRQKYRTGMVETRGTTVIVSNGIGTIFPPIRLFAPAQIVVVTLHRAG